MLKVSIIVPVHNSEKTIMRCVDSILSQDYKNIECILVENGSADDSGLMCEKLAGKHENIVYKSMEEAGVSLARNAGLSIANGDIIGFCDADDYLAEDAISSIVKEFEGDSKLASVIGGFYVGPSKEDMIYKGKKEQIISSRRGLQLVLTDDSVMGSVWNKYYRSEFLKGVVFDTGLSFCEDMHFNAIVLNGISPKYRIKVLNVPLYCYVDNPESVTHSEHLLFDENDELKYIVALQRIAHDCTLDKKTVSYLRMKIACFAIDTYKDVRDDKEKAYKLKLHVKQNYMYLLKNVMVNNRKWNIKRLMKGMLIIVNLYGG